MFRDIVQKFVDRRTFIGTIAARVAALSAGIVGLRSVALAGAKCEDCGTPFMGCCLCQTHAGGCEDYCLSNPGGCVEWCWTVGSGKNQVQCHECLCGGGGGTGGCGGGTFWCDWCDYCHCSWATC